MALPVLYGLFVWWFSTGAILYLDGLPRHTFRWSMLGATALFGAAVYGLCVSRDDPSPGGAYLAFTSGLVIWAWLEMTYYMGFVTGPRRQACAPGCSGWAHFGHAVQSSLYHEILTIGLAALILGLTWQRPDRVGLWTFVVLWVMQLSAKLNVFLGVPNVSEEFLPEHLSFLKSFLTKKPMNLLFPLSVTVSIVVESWLVQKTIAADAASFEATGLAFLATLIALAILEHWFLVLPLPSAALWTWSLNSRDAAQPMTIPAEGVRRETAAALSLICPHCGPQSDGAIAGSAMTAQPRNAQSSIPRKRVTGVFAEAALPQPATPSIARRQI